MGSCILGGVPTQLELYAWAAGVLEGEGSFTLHNRNYPRVTCSMTDKDILDRLVAVLGGRVTERLRKNSGQPHWKPAWSWYVCGNEAAAVMRLVHPWMGERRGARIDHVLAVNDDRNAKHDARRSAIVAAARRFVAGEGTYRRLAQEHGVSHMSVFTEAKKIRGESRPTSSVV